MKQANAWTAGNRIFFSDSLFLAHGMLQSIKKPAVVKLHYRKFYETEIDI